MALNPIALRKPTELFGPSGEEDVPERLWRRIRRTIWVGCIVGIGFLFGVGLWASLAPVSGAVMAPGVIKVENNLKTVQASGARHHPPDPRS